MSLKCQLGNPIGGLVFSSAFTGQIQQLHEWTVRADNFIYFTRDSSPIDFFSHGRISSLPTSFASAVAAMGQMRLGSAITSMIRWVADGTCLAITIPVSTHVKRIPERYALYFKSSSTRLTSSSPWVYMVGRPGNKVNRTPLPLNLRRLRRLA